MDELLLFHAMLMFLSRRQFNDQGLGNNNDSFNHILIAIVAILLTSKDRALDAQLKFIPCG